MGGGLGACPKPTYLFQGIYYKNRGHLLQKPWTFTTKTVDIYYKFRGQKSFKSHVNSDWIRFYYKNRGHLLQKPWTFTTKTVDFYYKKGLALGREP